MAQKKEKLMSDSTDEIERTKKELEELKAELEKKKVPAKKEEKKKKVTTKKEEKKIPAKKEKKKIPAKKEEKKEPDKKEEKKKKVTTKKEKKKIPAKKEEKKKKVTAKKEEKKKKVTAKKEEKKEPDKKEEKKTYEEELEEQLSDEEIQNFQIEKMDMEKLTNKVCDIVVKYQTDGMLQSELWKKLKLTSRDGSRLALKLERLGIISREKILEKGRWTYKLIIKKTPVSTESIENAPCLTCPVEQKCSLEGEISPRSCQLIEDWVLISITKSKKAKWN